MSTYYVVDTRTNRIVNAIESNHRVPTLDSFTDSEHLRLDQNPPMEMLRRYRFWGERP